MPCGGGDAVVGGCGRWWCCGVVGASLHEGSAGCGVVSGGSRFVWLPVGEVMSVLKGCRGCCKLRVLREGAGACWEGFPSFLFSCFFSIFLYSLFLSEEGIMILDIYTGCNNAE